MAQYQPSFVNVNPFINAISQGLEEVAQVHQKQDQIVQAQIDDFQKNYNPSKLRDDDLPAFTNAFARFKDAALRYSRLNRAGAKPEEMAVANALKDKAMNEMNSLYSNSVKASRHLDENSKAIQTARMKGYAVPSELNDTYMALSNNSIDNIDINKIPSAWSFKFTPDETDVVKLNNFMNAALKDHTKAITTNIKSDKPFGKTVSGKDLYEETPVTVSSADAHVATSQIARYASAHPEVDNDAKQAYDSFVNGVKSGDRESLYRFDKIKTALGLPADATVDKIGKYDVYGSDWYLPKESYGKTNRDQAEFERKLDDERWNRYMEGQKLQVSKQAAENKNKPSGFIQPSTVINSVVDSKKGGDYSDKFNSYRVKDSNGNLVFIKKVLYGKDSKGMGSFSVKIGSENHVFTPEAFNNFLVSEIGEISQKQSEPIRPQSKMTTNTGKGKNPDTLGIL